MKKLKIILLNTLIIFGVFALIDFCIYSKFKNEYIDSGIDIKIYPPISYIENYKQDFSESSSIFQHSKNNKLDYFRQVSGQKFKNRNSILIFGCSFAYSYGLDDNQTINEKLSQLTKRTVYNFGICACGIQHMLQLIKNPDLYNKINKIPDQVIYIYIPSHLQRLQSNIFPSPIMTNGINLKYKFINNELLLDNNKFLDIFSKTFIVKSLFYQQDIKRDNETIENKIYNANLAKSIFVESKKLLEKRYPNIKFTILKYEVEEDESPIELPQMWDELKNEGFTIIKSSELIGRKFKYNSIDTNEDHYHPSSYAFDLLVPPLVKELNL